MQMTVSSGSIVISSPGLTDPWFEQSVILITQNNGEGSIGFILNKQFPRALHELEEFKDCKPIPLFTGGPVAADKIFFIHQCPDLIKNGKQIDVVNWMGGDFNQALQLVNTGRISSELIKIFIGYCGWDPGQLAAEIEEGSFISLDINQPNLLTSDTNDLWDNLANQKK